MSLNAGKTLFNKEQLTPEGLKFDNLLLIWEIYKIDGQSIEFAKFRMLIFFPKKAEALWGRQMNDEKVWIICLLKVRVGQYFNFIKCREIRLIPPILNHSK